MTVDDALKADPGTHAFWKNRWQTGQTRWDQSGAHPHLQTMLKLADEAGALPAGAKILEPGCGRAHNGAALASLGFQVTSFDVVAEAIQGARELYSKRANLQLQTGDALVVQDSWRARFHAVFDRAMLCALPPEKRRTYLETCYAHLQPGGYFLSILFKRIVYLEGQSGPPFEIQLPELEQLIAPLFSVVTAQDHAVSDPNDRIKIETLVLLRRS